MRSPQVAGIVGKFKNVICESSWCLDEHAIGSWNECDRLSPRDVPDARKIPALQDRQLRDGNILEISSPEAAVCAVEGSADFIDPAWGDDSRQCQLEELIAAVFSGSVDAELTRTQDIRLIENIAAI